MLQTVDSPFEVFELLPYAGDFLVAVEVCNELVHTPLDLSLKLFSADKKHCYSPFDITAPQLGQ